ncbi:MAG: hypothetical protein PHS33_08745 [Candidatus Omnitrophica bacterium]|nr:hypothetical protein [Candidatus Omnitrophota bacterium]MDD5219831.1 hypothetical protein [Candidatus Bipolaricaulis sp.]
MSEKTVVKTKGEVLRDYVTERLEIGKDFWTPYQEIWRGIREEYIGQLNESKEEWQGNFIIPTVKKIVRNLSSMYIEMLLSKGAESFDLEPGEESDKQNAENLRLKIIYDLRTLEIERKILPIIQNFVLYGYAVAYVPWRHSVEKMRTGKNTVKEVVTFDSPDLECADIFNLYSDPTCKDMSSWKIYIKTDVPIQYLKQKEKEKVFFNVNELKSSVSEGVDVVDLMEYHGLVPKKLIEGQMDDLTEADPFEDDYIQAIIVVANNDVVIRATSYPYWCNNIFVAFVNDHSADEIAGIGVGEDIRTLAPMLTNLYNKLTDCVNLVTNPAYELVVNRYLGRGQTLLTRPGRIFPVKELNSIREIDTTTQASSLQLIPQLISMINGIIEEVTGATPQIMPTGNRKDVHSTATGLAMMTERSMQPINSKVKFYLEPAFRKILEIIYRHNIQYFKRANAVRILGGKKARELNLSELTRADIMLKGNPDFIPTGISGFMERQIEIRNLLDFMKIGANAMIPAMEKDLMGNEQPIYGEDGKPAMKPFVNLTEIVRRIAELFKFKDIEKLIPEEETPKLPQPQRQNPQGQSAISNSRLGMQARPTPVLPAGGNFLSRTGGQVPQ